MGIPEILNFFGFGFRASNGQFFLCTHHRDRTGYGEIWSVEEISSLSHIVDGQPRVSSSFREVAGSFPYCKSFIESKILEEKRIRLSEEKEKKRLQRIEELKQAYEASGRKKNIADVSEMEDLLSLTEKKTIQQCRRPQCHGCKLGWICPKAWSE